MSAVREFKQVSILYGDHRVMGVQVRCRCGAICEHPRGSTKGFNAGTKEDWQRHRAFFERRGWQIGERPQDDRCPHCCEKQTPAKPAKPKFTVVPKTMETPMPPSQATQSTQPREPTREDKRLIIAKLDDVYDTAAQRYSDAWTDARLAADLGCPRAWVERLRHDLYGPEGSNQEINAAVNEANTVLAQARTLIANAQKLIDDHKATLVILTASTQKLTGEVDRIARKVEGIEKAVRP